MNDKVNFGEAEREGGLGHMEFEAKSLAADYGISAGYEEAGLAPERPLEVIEGEILFWKAQTGGAIIEIGRRLIEAKEQLKHGEWERWLEEKVDFSVRTAQRFMKLAREYGESDILTLLGTRKALALLALKPFEREEFIAETHEVDGVEKTAQEMSGDELERLIRERKEAMMEAEQARADAATAEEARQKMAEDIRLVNKSLADQKADAAKYRERANRLAEELKDLKDRPVEVAVHTDEAAVEKARQEGLAEGRKAAEEKAAADAGKVDKAMKDLRLRLEKAERESKDAKEQAGELQKKLEAAGKQSKLAGREELVKFNIHFRTAQEQVEEMGAILRSLRADGETGLADKLGNAMDALRELIGDQMEGE